jgi:hypothetical protein
MFVNWNLIFHIVYFQSKFIMAVLLIGLIN